jgi:hypothetical protein
MSALDAALQQIDDVAADGDLAATPTAALPAVDPEDAGEPVELPDTGTHQRTGLTAHPSSAW